MLLKKRLLVTLVTLAFAAQAAALLNATADGWTRHLSGGRPKQKRQHPMMSRDSDKLAYAACRGVASHSVRFLDPDIAANMSLNSIMAFHGTDKASADLFKFWPQRARHWWHGFAHGYDAQLRARRGEITSLVEIGVKDGASLRAWRDYLPRATVFGLDIADKTCLFDGDGLDRPALRERLRLRKCDQSDAAIMQGVAEWARAELGGAPIDVVIDDGGHSMRQQQTTMQVMWPDLARGGVYVVEDLHTSFAHGPGVIPMHHDHAVTTFDVVRGLADGRAIDGSLVGNLALVAREVGRVECWAKTSDEDTRMVPCDNPREMAGAHLTAILVKN